MRALALILFTGLSCLLAQDFLRRGIQRTATSGDPTTCTPRSGYAHCRVITIDDSKVSGGSDLTDFTVLISGTYSYLAVTGSGGEVESASGYDIVFTSDQSGATLLSWEQERWIDTTGEVVYWVKIPTVYAAAPTYLYLHYGNAGIMSFQGGATGAAWSSDYRGVWHVPDGSSLSGADSSSDDNDATFSGSPSAISAVIDGGVRFNGSSQYGDATTGPSPSTTFTLSAWVNPDAFPASGQRDVVQGIGYDAGNDSVKLSFGFYNASIFGGGGQTFGCWTYTGGGGGVVTGAFAAVSGNFSTATWYNIACVFNGSTWKVYKNGVELGTLTSSQAPHTSTNVWGLGANIDSGAAWSDYFDGDADELRVSFSAKSADWLLTEYNSQSDPAIFYSVGSEM